MVSQFWEDLNDDLQDPEFRRAYIAESTQLQRQDWEIRMARRAMAEDDDE